MNMYFFLTCNPFRARETNFVRLLSNASRKGLKQIDLSSYEGLRNKPVHWEFSRSTKYTYVTVKYVFVLANNCCRFTVSFLC